MKLHWQKQSSETTRLLLIFSGWSVDWHLFARYDYPAGYDVAVVWDYTVLSNDIFADLRDYDETVVIAWSFGVASFNVLHQSLPSRLNLNCAIAVMVQSARWTITSEYRKNIFFGYIVRSIRRIA